MSEPGRARPAGRVLDWLSGLPSERLYISILTLGEMDKGIESLRPDDGRLERLLAYRAMTEARFKGRVLSLDDQTIRSWGVLAGRYRRTFGGDAPAVDTMLTATAQRHRLYLATRNVRDVRPLGAVAFDPWTDDPEKFPLTV